MVVWYRGAPSHLHLSKGAHTLEFKIYNQDSPPALWVGGRWLVSDSSWTVTFEDKEWIDATGKASDKSGTVWLPAEVLGFSERPSQWKLKTEARSAVRSERAAHSLLVDFGRESFGYIDLHGLKGKGKLSLYYGDQKKRRCRRIAVRYWIGWMWIKLIAEIRCCPDRGLSGM